MTESGTEQTEAPGWDIDWSSARTWTRALAVGVSLSLAISFVVVVCGLSVTALIAEENRFLAFAAHMILCAVIFFFAAIGTAKLCSDSLKNLDRGKLEILASSHDRLMFPALFLFVVALSSSFAWYALGFSEPLAVSTFVSSMMGPELITIHSVPALLIKFLGHTDPRHLPDPTAEHFRLANKRARTGLMTWAFGNMYFLLFLVVLVVIVGFWRL